MRILVVEDEIELQEAIADGLRMEGYAVDTCDNGEDAVEFVFCENYDIIILDLNLPKMDGYEVLLRIREDKPDIKVIILSARGSVDDKVKGLDIGANDYLSKPFHFAELEARIRNLLRQKFVHQNNIISCGHISIDLSKRTSWIGDTAIHLTKKEFAILEYFLLNPERVISQEELMEHVWDQNMNHFSGSVRVHIASLRKKLKAILHDDPIATKIGEGYRIVNGKCDESC
ncbi:response regulator transcription factor [Paenibacillus pinihumi]|uniref:response regulator transcription factor n=1 Tax=Paenibacillus pinihumi TaxID=669462 RepID=UPI000420EAE4|nr:response regulator transcription factor [Paenibacillus pinihumi]